jgi:hypothetical protein
MVIVQINYRPDVPRAEWEKRYTDETAARFLKVEGLQWKVWLDASDRQEVGGIYLFADAASAQAYLDGPIVAGMQANPLVKDLQIKMFDVRERMTAITNGPIPGLALAAE